MAPLLHSQSRPRMYYLFMGSICESINLHFHLLSLLHILVCPACLPIWLAHIMRTRPKQATFLLWLFAAENIFHRGHADLSRSFLPIVSIRADMFACTFTQSVPAGMCACVGDLTRFHEAVHE